MHQFRVAAHSPAAAWLAAALLLTATTARAQRPGGVVGQYVPPRTWPNPPHGFDLLHQRVAIRFDMAQRSLAGEVTTSAVVTREPTDTIRLDAQHLTIEEARAADRGLRFTADTGHVTVRLPRRAAVGDTVEFTLRYHGTPERGIYFVPRRDIIWSQGQPIETRAWVPTYDAPDDKTTWELLVTADTGLNVLSNGRLDDVTPAEGGAAKVWHWVQDQPASSYLYSVVVGPLTVLTDHWRGIPVHYWVYPDTVDAAWRTLGETPSMIELYSRLLVPFPWAKYDQSMIPDIEGGMENVSATTLSDLTLHSAGEEPESSGRVLIAHELAHQWFGNLVTIADWEDLWLNEGMATYMESVHNELTRGRDAAQLEWIQQQHNAVAVDRWQPRPLVWGEYQGSNPMALFRSGHIFVKGAQLAHQLRRLLGDSLFWGGLNRYLTENAYQAVTTGDFAVAFEQTCHCDLDWFFDQWAYGIGVPAVHWSRQWSPALHALQLTVEQTQPVDSIHPLFRFPVTVRVITRDTVVRTQITVSRRSETFTIPLPGEPLSVRFDEGGWLLGEVTGDMTLGEMAEMAKHDLDFSARYWALEQLAGSSDTVAVEAQRFIVLNEHDPALRRLALRQMAGDTAAEGVTIIRSALRDPDSGVRAQALTTLAGLDTATARAQAETMVASDPNAAVRAYALRVLARTGGSAALPLFLENVHVGHGQWVRWAAAEGLLRFHTPEAMSALADLTGPNEDRNIRRMVLDMMAQQADTAQVVDLATRYLDDPDPVFAIEAVDVLAQVGGATARALLLERYGTETRPLVRQALTRVLRQ